MRHQKWSRTPSLRPWPASTRSSTCAAPPSSPRITCRGPSTCRCWSDAERAEVGTIYVQEFRLPGAADRRGQGGAQRRRHLETALEDRPANFRPLVYCWRGGQRSNAMATILSQVGWRTARAGRRLQDLPAPGAGEAVRRGWPLRLVLLDGGTGSGKTAILGAAGGAWRPDPGPGRTGPSSRLAVRRLCRTRRNPARRCSRAGCLGPGRLDRRGPWWSRRSPARSATSTCRRRSEEPDEGRPAG